MSQKQATVRQLIEELQKLPPDLPVYVRGKYAKDVQSTDDYPIKAQNVRQMESCDLAPHPHVTILF